MHHRSCLSIGFGVDWEEMYKESELRSGTVVFVELTVPAQPSLGPASLEYGGLQGSWAAAAAAAVASRKSDSVQDSSYDVLLALKMSSPGHVVIKDHDREIDPHIPTSRHMISPPVLVTSLGPRGESKESSGTLPSAFNWMEQGIKIDVVAFYVSIPRQMQQGNDTAKQRCVWGWEASYPGTSVGRGWVRKAWALTFEQAIGLGWTSGSTW
ncbi:hypothetical protein EIP91_002249 [Steccherinum ochraceum]|uniref:Uncharacterized protein n=1 Tax=Steccherinum ochraceum TaxID=92696 RepID=A0A4R0RTA2_9APHY|nr:hypothetical protein EIP91_002249 [Steccherinum ochraceum]